MRSFTDTLNDLSELSFPIGDDSQNNLIRADLKDISHLLITGATGTGKSVFLHSLLLTLIHNNSPDLLRLVLFDSKLVELSVYNGASHLLLPVITDYKKLTSLLNWTTFEISKRLSSFAQSNERSLPGYNDYLWENFLSDNGLPRILIVIDDLTSVLTEVPETLDKVKQILLTGRTVGIHLIAVTQTPTWKNTKQISAMFRTKVVFSASTSTESKFLIGRNGAERLGPCGNAMFSKGGVAPVKINSIPATEKEFDLILSASKELKAPYSDDTVKYAESVLAQHSDIPAEAPNDTDELLPAAVEVVLETGQVSVSMLQRRLKLGYSRAARLIDQMEEQGIVGPFEGSKPRQLLITRSQWQEMQCPQGSKPSVSDAPHEDCVFKQPKSSNNISCYAETTPHPIIEKKSTTSEKDLSSARLDAERLLIPEKKLGSIFKRLFGHD